MNLYSAIALNLVAKKEQETYRQKSKDRPMTEKKNPSKKADQKSEKPKSDKKKDVFSGLGGGSLSEHVKLSKKADSKAKTSNKKSKAKADITITRVISVSELITQCVSNLEHVIKAYEHGCDISFSKEERKKIYTTIAAKLKTFS